MIVGKKEWSEDEFDLELYNGMDDEGKRAWEKIFGLPKLLKNGNPPADTDENTEIAIEALP